ncbi:putative uncharacterized protein [Ruminococcus sp. CAG:382]|nr:putative uncharacterized protein [Ruminococcus sp. CAG:382]
MLVNTYTFRRIEKKYLLNRETFNAFFFGIRNRIVGDEYGKSTICSAYLDTPDYRLIRTSLDAEDYKEKLRLRSYGKAAENGTVFLEIKKKCGGVVYKRRVSTQYTSAIDYITNGVALPDSQIQREIDYAMSFYGRPRPMSVICYEREAFFVSELPALRITFDTNVRCRLDSTALTDPPDGTLLLPDDTVIMEIKTDGAMPLWLTNRLDCCGIIPHSFSKYGTAYRQLIANKRTPF